VSDEPRKPAAGLGCLLFLLACVVSTLAYRLLFGRWW
jgi:hypothetical protein